MDTKTNSDAPEGCAPTEGSAVLCLGYGWIRERYQVGPLNLGEYCSRVFQAVDAKERLFWWWDLDCKRHTAVVRDGDETPRLKLAEKLPFEVVSCSFDELTVRTKQNAQADPRAKPVGSGACSAESQGETK